MDHDRPGHGARDSFPYAPFAVILKRNSRNFSLVVGEDAGIDTCVWVHKVGQDKCGCAQTKSRNRKRIDAVVIDDEINIDIIINIVNVGAAAQPYTVENPSRNWVPRVT